jgi:hypothetical protein
MKKRHWLRIEYFDDSLPRLMQISGGIVTAKREAAPLKKQKNVKSVGIYETQKDAEETENPDVSGVALGARGWDGWG